LEGQYGCDSDLRMCPALPFDKSRLIPLSSQAGLFSASVTAFIMESYKKLSRDSGDTTVLLFAHISLPRRITPVEALSLPNTFQPTLSTLRVNAVWFLSLAFGLTCALGQAMGA